MLNLQRPNKVYKIGNITTSDVEIKHLIKAWLVISLAFAIVDGGLSFTNQFFVYLITAAIAVGSGFLLHELAHKIVAQRYGCFAEFRADNMMLMIALGMAILLRAVFAAPGAVIIAGGHIDFRRNGKISLAGPLTNVVLSMIFIGLNFIYPSMIFSYGAFINAWLALFNMIPFGFFDGIKIWRWSKAAYLLTVIASLSLVFLGSSGI